MPKPDLSTCPTEILKVLCRCTDAGTSAWPAIALTEKSKRVVVFGLLNVPATC